MPRLAATLLPMTTYVITTAPLGERLAEVVGYRGGVSDSDLADNHYRIVGGDRLMLSGRATARPRDPRRYVGALTADIKKTYPQLGDVTAEYAWAGTLGITMHRMPQIGELGPGVWLASGFGGHGLNTTAMAGNIVARAIVEGDATWRQFTPFELVWAGGAFGRAAAQARVWIKRLRDRIEERRAKARELAHRQVRDVETGAEAARQVADGGAGAGAGDGGVGKPAAFPATTAIWLRRCNSLPRSREGERSAAAARKAERGAKPAKASMRAPSPKEAAAGQIGNRFATNSPFGNSRLRAVTPFAI